MVGGTGEGVVPRLAAAVEKGPVARLDREKLARGPLGGADAEARSERAQDPQLKPTRGPGKVANRRRVPGAEVLLLAPCGGGKRAIGGLVRRASLAESDEREPCLRCAGEHR